MNESLPISVENLSFRYRDRSEPAIRNISFAANKGEILLIAGASGCGKTTLIRAINGLIPRSYKGELTGLVQVYGQDTRGWKLSQISQNIGTVLQDPERQILGTKVINEVAFGLENLGLTRDEIIPRVEQALSYLKIIELRDRETFNLSGGEKQKVALAGVLAMRPSILLLDEPLASLDPASAQDTLDAVRQMADEGLTILIIEHRIEDVLRINPNRVMFLSGGEIRYLGDIQGLSKVVNYREVKLPAEEILTLARHDPHPIGIITSLKSADSTSRRIKTEEVAGKPLVRFEKVEFEYEAGNKVLQDINFEIKTGDVIAVLGPNGAGKTTFVKQAIGLLKPTSGRVMVNEKDTKHTSVANIASTLGYVFQSPSHMLFAPTVSEELSFGPTNLKHNPDRIKKEVKNALEIVNLVDHEQDAPLALSFGQQKRVSIAAVLAMQSRILVMDEPTAGQDYQNYLSFMDSIVEMPGIEAILFITHDVDLAVIYANRILMISNGHLIADGAPQEVLLDFDQLRANRLVPTSLLTLNLKMLSKTGRFMRAEALAHIN